MHGVRFLLDLGHLAHEDRFLLDVGFCAMSPVLLDLGYLAWCQVLVGCWTSHAKVGSCWILGASCKYSLYGVRFLLDVGCLMRH